jgi:hypothetical protein
MKLVGEAVDEVRIEEQKQTPELKKTKYLIGFPWESDTHLMDTYNHIFAIDAEFIEIHMFPTEVHKLCKIWSQIFIFKKCY